MRFSRSKDFKNVAAPQNVVVVWWRSMAENVFFFFCCCSFYGLTKSFLCTCCVIYGSNLKCCIARQCFSDFILYLCLLKLFLTSLKNFNWLACHDCHVLKPFSMCIIAINVYRAVSSYSKRKLWLSPAVPIFMSQMDLTFMKLQTAGVVKQSRKKKKKGLFKGPSTQDEEFDFEVSTNTRRSIFLRRRITFLRWVFACEEFFFLIFSAKLISQ